MKPRMLSRNFYAHDTVQVAKNLLNKRLVRLKGEDRMEGRIVEVEAYRGGDDPASHAFRGPTRRNAAMFGEPGHAYVYFTYGNHYCLNITTQQTGTPGAVLIRAIEPVEGVRAMRRLRPKVSDLNLTSGPGRLTKALGIGKLLNGIDMTKRGPLFVVESGRVQFKMGSSTRVGISQGTDRLWRFYVPDNPFVSKRSGLR